VSKPVLTVVLASADLASQRDHLARGALFLPEPQPPPEPFAEIVLRVESPSGTAVELAGRVLQILSGRGIAVSFDDLAGAKTKLAPLFSESAQVDDTMPTMIFWGRSASSADLDAAARAALAAPAPVSEVVVDDDAAPAEEDRDASAKLRDEIGAMSANEKMQLALKGDRLARFLLLKEPNKSFQIFILQNARVTLDEVRYIAGFRQASPDALVTIGANRDWVANPGIVSALVRNPKTPSGTAVKLLDKLPIAEIRRLAKSNDVPRAVQAAARKRATDAIG